MPTLEDVVFLGGTVGKSNWREEIFIPGLLERGVSPDLLFNPVVEEWNEAAQQYEDEVKRRARYLLFVITHPEVPDNEISGYSLVEATMALYDDPDRVILAFDTRKMNKYTERTMRKTYIELKRRFPDAPVFYDMESAMEWLAERLV